MYFQSHGIQQKRSENKSAALKSYYFCSYALIERSKINPQLLQNNLYVGLSYFPFFLIFYPFVHKRIYRGKLKQRPEY